MGSGRYRPTDWFGAARKRRCFVLVQGAIAQRARCDVEQDAAVACATTIQMRTKRVVSDEGGQTSQARVFVCGAEEGV
jgi:hypothetical protein